MPLQKIVFPSGIFRDQTRFASDGRWFDCDKIRFRSGLPQKIGGWERYSTNTTDGQIRFLLNFISLDENNYLAIGSSERFYIEEGGSFNNITPLRKTSSLGADPITTGGAGSGVITVSDTGHGAVLNDFVTLAGATTTDSVTAAQINITHQITEIVSVNAYKVETAGSAGGTVAGGGGSVTAAYEINVGLDTAVQGTGFGAGTYSRGTYGSGATIPAGAVDQLRLWSGDNFGEDLVFNVRNGGVYYWDASGGTGVRADALSDETGASDAPTIAVQVMVSNNDRHVIAFGCNDRGATAQDKLLIRWSDQENAVDWTPTTANTAGDLRLNSGSEIVRAYDTRQEILVWTEEALFSMRFVGPPFTFGHNVLSRNTTLIAPNAVASLDGAVYWMGLRDFFVYTGRVQELPSTVRDYVFGDINLAQAQKIHAGTIKDFGEIVWFYCSADATEIDRYVIYNSFENCWYFGTLSRTAWLDSSSRDYPIGANSVDYKIYNHELGLNDGEGTSPTGISAYVESSDFEIGEGDRFQFIRRIYPDISFFGSTDPAPAVNFLLKPRNFPGSAFGTSDTSEVAGTKMVDVQEFTEQSFVRVRSRQVAFRVESSGTNIAWKLGVPRIDIRPDGRK
tara:strand:- start:266 stop:2128 length:1863 start_codon:yes stop_codon:yes gene_type:complete